MQLNQRKASAGAAQVTPQLVLSKDDITASTLTGNTQQVLQRESRWRIGWSWLAANPKVAFGLGIVAFFALVAILGPIIFRQDPTAFSSDVLQAPSVSHWLGTTQTGQDVFAQVVVGTPLSLFLAFPTALLPTPIPLTIAFIPATLR